MEQYAIVFKVLSDATRLRVLRLLLEAGRELCVCELVDSLEEPQYNISKHLNALKTAGLLKSRREGRWIYYFPAPGSDGFFRSLLDAVSAIPEAQAGRDRA